MTMSSQQDNSTSVSDMHSDHEDSVRDIGAATQPSLPPVSDETATAGTATNHTDISTNTMSEVILALQQLTQQIQHLHVDLRRTYGGVEPQLSDHGQHVRHHMHGATPVLPSLAGIHDIPSHVQDNSDYSDAEHNMDMKEMYEDYLDECAQHMGINAQPHMKRNNMDVLPLQPLDNDHGDDTFDVGIPVMHSRAYSLHARQPCTLREHSVKGQLHYELSPEREIQHTQDEFQVNHDCYENGYPTSPTSTTSPSCHYIDHDTAYSSNTEDENTVCDAHTCM